MLTADISIMIQHNLFAYCLNNPVNMDDDGGQWPNWVKKAVAAVAVVVVVATVAAVSVATCGTGAAVSCALLGAAHGAAVGMASGAVTGAVTGAVSHRLTTGSWKGAGQAALDGAADGALSGAITGAITGGIKSPYCFIAGTAIVTAAGYVAIENIAEGDVVFAWNETSDEVELKRVAETYVNETDELIHLYVNGEKITTTPSHPFYSPVKGWTDAVNLRAGDMLVLVNGEYVVLEKVQHEILESPITVYNFQVEDDHTYYVGESGILVHNACSEIKAQRQSAVRKAWQIEADNVRAGTSTYNWSQSQVDELLTRGKISGYHGHHVISVKANPALAGDPSNIRFVTRAEHLYQHFGNWRNPTYGWRP